MPFTVSHVALALPLMRTPLPASALVIGSTVPDLPVHLAHRPTEQTHSWTGLVGEDLLLGLALWALWHGLLAAPVLAGAPQAVRSRAAGLRLGLCSRLRDRRELALVPVALFVGSALHVFVDSFTHVDRWGTHLVPALSHTYAGYSWLQYGGSVLGLAVIAIVLLRAWRGPGQTWSAVIGVAALVGALIGLHAAATTGDLRTIAYYAITRASALLLAAVLVLAVGWHLRRAVRTA
ncbi:DUF4184 family protein [Sporichthya sp.]|uniref:DUF4184 family protein n=1 Tax=Sporichthya sp. TaxID=65475 RepID=UPI0017B95CB1|nr:DUF4184 family protein [Sporichthya sp.]MBA3741957.1 DUF4184 family protein [Sporichthya sp.]